MKRLAATQKRKKGQAAVAKKPRVELKAIEYFPSGNSASASAVKEEKLDARLQQQIEQFIKQRRSSTVRIRPLPSGLQLQQLYSLCPAAVSVRLPWNHARRRHKGVAFLEFDSASAAGKHARALSGNKSLGRELRASICEEGDAVQLADFNLRRLTVCSLSQRTTAKELISLIKSNVASVADDEDDDDDDESAGSDSDAEDDAAAAAASSRGKSKSAAAAVRVQLVHSSSRRSAAGKHAPHLAVVQFRSAAAALQAARTLHGVELHSLKSSWMFEKRSSVPKPQARVDKTIIVISGIAKSVTQRQLRAALPNCANLQLLSSGMAVARYADEASCAADLGDGQKQVGPARLRLKFGHRSLNESLTLATQPERNRHPSSASCVLLLADLPPAVTEQQLLQFAPQAQQLEFTANRRMALLVFQTRKEAVAVRNRFRAQLFLGKLVPAAFTAAGLKTARKVAVKAQAAAAASAATACCCSC